MRIRTAALVSILGLWVGELDVPDQEAPIVFELFIESVGEQGELRGSVAVSMDHSPIVGNYDAAPRSLECEADFDDDDTIRLALQLDDDGLLQGTATLGDVTAELRVARSNDPPRFFHDSGFPLPDELPAAVLRTSLEPELGALVQTALEEEVESANAPGAALAIIRGDEVVDLRCIGWEDLAARVPASRRTRYRWASLAKPMTAVAALQLYEQDRLDLEEDVRELVPEFSDKGSPITAHHLLAHHAGIPHAGSSSVVPDESKYAVDHPWSSRILLDHFRDLPLVAEPGARFFYSTYGYMLLGAVVERAGEEEYEAQVRARILEPLGMTTTEPDYPWSEIPHRAVGYRGLRIGLATLDPDRDVSWKLPAGGWISSIEDVGLLAAGLLGGRLLEPETRDLMFSTKVPRDGRDPGYGYGIGVRMLDGVEVVSHSGTQSMASSFLILCPGEDIGVAVLSNTGNFDSRRLALRVFGLLR